MLYVPDTREGRLLDLASFMEDLSPRLYDQSIIMGGDNCGCIAYWACIRAMKNPSIETARDYLGIDNYTASLLFHSDAGASKMLGCTLGPAKPKDAARALRHLAVTGNVPGYWMS